MANFNKVILAGNLTRDPELRYTPKGTAVAKFGIAVNRNWTTESGEKKEERRAGSAINTHRNQQKTNKLEEMQMTDF